MRTALGTIAVASGLSAAVFAVMAYALGIRRRDPRLFRIGRRFTIVLFVATLAAAAVMEWALLSHDFSLAYVARNGSRSTPLLYTFASLWGALEGSILLWALVLAGYLVFMVRKFRDRADDPLVCWAMLTGLSVAVFFMALMMGPANPFSAVSGPIPLDGPGPNPLLQNHPLMAIHPPMLYLGYVGFTVPFAFAVAALVTGRLGEGWLIETRRATLVAWGFLTLGIGLGAWWSYEVLGWGGYWAWDPVENASFLPWLTGTAYVHSVIMQERRGMLRVWNLSLLIATFCLTILGTFLTRSGVINSVHSFTQSPIGPWLLSFLGVTMAVGVGLIAWRGDRLRSPGRIDSPVSREGAFLVNNLLFGAFAFVVLLGTVFPLLAEAIDGRQLSVGEPYFERMTVPLGLALLFFMAVAPALPWRVANGEVLRNRLIGPAWAGGLVMVTAVVLGARGVAQLATFGLAAFALAGIIRQVWLGWRAQRRGNSGRVSSYRGVIRSGWALITGNRRLYGGLAVHAGVVIIAVALAASSGYATRREFRLGRGESASVRGYRVTYLGTQTESSRRKTTVSVRLRVERGGKVLGVYEPALSTYPATRQSIATPSVRNGLLRDLYLTLASTPNESGRVMVGVMVNPLVIWLWIGGGVMFIGTLHAAWPGGRSTRRRRTAAGISGGGDAADALDSGPEPPTTEPPDPDLLRPDGVPR